jgi:hypothetical protein
MMIGRKAIVGLSLFSALLFCAFVAQSASAAWGEAAKNTTAVTCVEKGGSKDFNDAHCDEKVEPGKGSFGHVAISNGTETEVEVTNEKTKSATSEPTPVVLTGMFVGVKFELVCNKVETDAAAKKSFLLNSEAVAGEHKVSGTIAVVLTECTVNKPANCTIETNQITMSASVEGREKAATNEMGLEFTPDKATSESFATIHLIGPKCPFAGKALLPAGSFVATGNVAPTAKWSGATLVLNSEKEMQSLFTVSGNAAELKGAFTVRMKGAEGKPISFTTTT